MPELRVHEPVQQLSARHPSAADPGADGDVAEGVEPLSRAPEVLAEGRRVHVGVEDDGHRQAPLDLLADIGVGPARLRRRRDVPPGRGRDLRVDRAERADPDRLDGPFALEERHDLVDRLLRSRRRDGLLRAQVVRAGADRTAPVRAAGLDPAERVRTWYRYDMAHRHEAAVAWGLLSTARINDASSRRARESDRAEVLAVASRDASRAEAYAREHGIERSLRKLRGAARRSRRRGRLHLAAELAARRVDAARARRREARALREAVLARIPTRSSRRSTGPRRPGSCSPRRSCGAITRRRPGSWSWSPTARSARCESSGRPSASVSARPTTCGSTPELDGGALMDVGCYCLSAIRLLAGEPERAAGRAGRRAERRRRLLHGGPRLRRRPARALRLRLRAAVPRRSSRSSGEDASLFVGDPFHAASPGIELRRADGTERIAVERANSYRLELENVADAIRGRGAAPARARRRARPGKRDRGPLPLPPPPPMGAS